MLDILELFVLLVLYGCIFAIPASLVGNRRKSKRPIYWWLLLVSVTMELAIIFTILIYAKQWIPTWLSLYLAPILAAMSAGIFYYYFSKKLDNNEQ